MENTNSFDISVSELPQDATNMENYLTSLFIPGTSNYNQLKHEIERENRFNGSPEVTAMQFDRVKFDAINGSGSFRVLLNINFTFGCEDVRVDKEHQTSEWSFKVDADTHTIRFSGSPFLNARSTADEF